MNFGSIPFGLQPQGPFLNQVQPSRYTQWNNPARNSSTQHRSLNGHTGNHQGIHFGNIDGSLPKNTNHLYQQLHHTGQQIHPQSGGFGIPNCGLPNGIRQAPQQYHHSGQQLPHQFGFANNTHHTGKPLQHSLQHQPTPQGESGLRGPPPVGSTNFHDGRTNGADPQHCQVDSHHDISPPNGQHHPPPTPSNTSPNNPAPQAARKPQKPHKKTTHSHVEAGQASRSTEATGNEQQTDLPVGPTQHEIITQFLNVNNPPSKSSPLVQLTMSDFLDKTTARYTKLHTRNPRKCLHPTTKHFSLVSMRSNSAVHVAKTNHCEIVIFAVSSHLGDHNFQYVQATPGVAEFVRETASTDGLKNYQSRLQAFLTGARLNDISASLAKKKTKKASSKAEVNVAREKLNELVDQATDGKKDSWTWQGCDVALGKLGYKVVFMPGHRSKPEWIKSYSNGLLQPEAKLVNEDIDNRLIRVIHDQEALIGRTRATVRKPHSPRTAQSGIEHANLEGTVNGDGSKQTTTAQLQSPPTRKQKSPGTRTTAPPKQKRARKTPAAQRKARLPPLTAAERALDPSSSESDSKTRNSFSVIQDSSSQSDHLSESGHRRSCENEDSTASNQSHSNEVATPAICKKWRPKKVSPSRLTTSTVPGSSNKGSPNSIIQPPISAPPLIASSAAVWDQPNRAALLT
ncbi:hypothetical protein PtB15_5B822 [Puccinia triticina]|nr:hypothetical protein PtB15_5B822 [Puccinia triticina]